MSPSTVATPSSQTSAAHARAQTATLVVEPISPGAAAGTRRDTVRKFLLGCGVLSSVLYIGTEMYA